MKRYWLLKDDSFEFLWDTKRKIMYGKEGGEYVGILHFTIEMLSKFRPFAKIVRRTDQKPSSGWFVSQEKHKKQIMGEIK